MKNYSAPGTLWGTTTTTTTSTKILGKILLLLNEIQKGIEVKKNTTRGKIEKQNEKNIFRLWRLQDFILQVLQQ